MNFKNQSAAWLRGLETRRRKPISPASLAAFSSYVRRLLSTIGPDTKLENINNGTLKALVEKLVAAKLSPKTILELVATVKQIVASAVDENGNQLFPRTWNQTFIDLPTIGKQKQPCVTFQDVERCMKDSATDQERIFYALLAGSGLRVAEALAIHVSCSDQTSWDQDAATISVRSSIYRGTEQNRVKTQAAVRIVDLDPMLNAAIIQFVSASGIQEGEYLFQSKSRRAMHLPTATRRLKKHGVKGFHAFRRFRITRLRELGYPEDLLRYAVGHAGEGITSRYSKLAENFDLRKQWTVRAGLGFELPPISEECPAPLKKSKPSKRHTSILSLSDPLPAEPSYKAEDSDLDPIFFAEAV